MNILNLLLIAVRFEEGRGEICYRKNNNKGNGLQILVCRTSIAGNQRCKFLYLEEGRPKQQVKERIGSRASERKYC